MKKFTTATTDIKKRRILRVVPVLAAAGILSVVLTGCGSSDEEVQRYSWPLATASPEDTVTQIFAEKFAEFRYTQTPRSEATVTSWRPVPTVISRLSYRIQLRRFLS